MRTGLWSRIAIAVAAVMLDACATSPEPGSEVSKGLSGPFTEVEPTVDNPPPISTHAICMNGCFNEDFDCQEGCYKNNRTPQSCLEGCDARWDRCTRRCDRMYPH